MSRLKKILQSKEHPGSLNIFREKTWLLILALCLMYWLYLIFCSKMQIIFDSVEYENTGRLIYQKGWMEFFRTGPYREPIYPALIALSMACADFLSINHQFILKIFQVALLFLTQILLIVLLQKLNVLEGIIKIAVFYFGISPTIINAAFSVYYEIVSFPFVVAVVLLAGSLWSDIHKKRKYKFILGKTILFAACFTLLALGRCVFQYIFYFFIFSFCISAIFAFFKRRALVLGRLLIFIAVSMTLYSSSVSYVKTMNLRYNGEYSIYPRHTQILLASAYRRSQPVSFRIIASHVASIPGNGVCRLLFSPQECYDADWYGIEKFRHGEVGQIFDTIPKSHREFQVICLVLGKVINHPFQYFFFSIVEALKMPFWESTQTGYVSYPEFLTKVYDCPFVRFGLRLLVGLMTLAAFTFVTFDLWRGKRRCFSMEGDQRNMVTLFFIWLMIAAYTFFYSLCYVLTRYALPIASLFIACIAFTMSEVIRSRSLSTYAHKEKRYVRDSS